MSRRAHQPQRRKPASQSSGAAGACAEPAAHRPAVCRWRLRWPGPARSNNMCLGYGNRLRSRNGCAGWWRQSGKWRRWKKQTSTSREGQTRGLETGELENILREAAEDLRPVAAEKNVRIALDFSGAPARPQSLSRQSSPGQSSPGQSSSRQSSFSQSWFAPVIFRLLDSALSLAESGTVVR